MLLKEKKRFDYYAFGMEMPGRSIGSDFAYNFNGKRTDKWNGDNGSYLDFGARIDDARLGRFFNPDPAKSGWSFEAPYIFAGNTPIQAIDENGEKIYFVNKDGTVLDLSVASNISKIDDKSFKMAYTTLIKTKDGKEVIEKYQKSNTHDIYFGKNYRHAYHGSEAAGTSKGNSRIKNGKYNSIGVILPENPEGIGVSPHAIFESVNFSTSVGKQIYLVELPYTRFNIDMEYASTFLGGKWIGTKGLNEYELAETIYHEIIAHIDFPEFVLPNIDSRTHYSQGNDHYYYGSFNTGLNLKRNIEEVIGFDNSGKEIKKEIISAKLITPYKKITKQLLDLKQKSKKSSNKTKSRPKF